MSRLYSQWKRFSCHNNAPRVLFIAAWLFSVLFACLACLPVYSVGWMAVPNNPFDPNMPNSISNTVQYPGGGFGNTSPELASAIMNIKSPIDPVQCTNVQPPEMVISPSPPPTPSVIPFKQEIEKDTSKKPKEKHCNSRPNCACDYSDVVDEHFFSILKGIGFGVGFIVSLPWYIISRFLEQCLFAAHWMVGRTISHPLTSIWGYSSILIISIWTLNSCGGFSTIITEFIAWISHSEAIQTNVIAHTRTRVVKQGIDNNHHSEWKKERNITNQRKQQNGHESHGRTVVKKGSSSKNEHHEQQHQGSHKCVNCSPKKVVKVRVVPVETSNEISEHEKDQNKGENIHVQSVEEKQAEHQEEDVQEETENEEKEPLEEDPSQIENGDQGQEEQEETVKESSE